MSVFKIGSQRHSGSGFGPGLSSIAFSGIRWQLPALPGACCPQRFRPAFTAMAILVKAALLSVWKEVVKGIVRVLFGSSSCLVRKTGGKTRRAPEGDTKETRSRYEQKPVKTGVFFLKQQDAMTVKPHNGRR